MWTTLTLMALSMAPAQDDKPEFKNIRYTHGILGQTRKKDSFLPGDAVCLTFDVTNMRVRKDGRILYSIGMEVRKKGEDKPVLKREAQDFEVTNTLGGGSFPAFATWPIPRDSQAPGEYTLKVTVGDRTTKKTATLTRKFTVLSTRLGFVQVYLATFGGDPTPPVAVPGQRVMLYYTLVGFTQHKEKKQANVTVSIRILDADGKPTLKEPFKSDIKSDAKAAPGIMLFNPFLLELNRAGKYTVELTAIDNLTKKETVEKLDLNVLKPK
jgi:hypothetical protein